MVGWVSCITVAPQPFQVWVRTYRCSHQALCHPWLLAIIVRGCTWQSGGAAGRSRGRVWGLQTQHGFLGSSRPMNYERVQIWRWRNRSRECQLCGCDGAASGVVALDLASGPSVVPAGRVTLNLVVGTNPRMMISGGGARGGTRSRVKPQALSVYIQA